MADAGREPPSTSIFFAWRYCSSSIVFVSEWIGTAFAEDDAAAAHTQWRRFADQARAHVPKLAAFMAEACVLAYMNFSVQNRAILDSTDPLGDLNG